MTHRDRYVIKTGNLRTNLCTNAYMCPSRNRGNNTDADDLL